MLKVKGINNGRKFRIGAMMVVALAMASSAYATKSLVRDRRVTMKEAQAMLKIAQANSDFPIVVNDLVLNELNRYIGTEDGRAFMRASLARMETYRGMIETKIAKYNVPIELMAIPIAESGYENRLETDKKGHGVGLWMFIKDTARDFGLRVDPPYDDRNDPVLETEAAMRYLLSNKLLLDNWLLAILAYNVGERGVLDAIENHGTRDPWTLIRKGTENDSYYLARVMASILIMKNPNSVQ